MKDELDANFEALLAGIRKSTEVMRAPSFDLSIENAYVNHRRAHWWLRFWPLRRLSKRQKQQAIMNEVIRLMGETK